MRSNALLTHALLRQQVRRYATIAAVAACALVLSACTSLSGAKSADAGGTAERYTQQPAEDGSLVSDGSIRHDTTDARVAELWGKAERSRFEQNAPAASTYILQAIELQPQNSVLLSRAAELQLTLKKPVLAESYAAKSNVFADSNRALLLRNWLIIEHSRAMRGDSLGQRTAHRKVQQFQ